LILFNNNPKETFMKSELTMAPVENT